MVNDVSISQGDRVNKKTIMINPVSISQEGTTLMLNAVSNIQRGCIRRTITINHVRISQEGFIWRIYMVCLENIFF